VFKEKEKEIILWQLQFDLGVSGNLIVFIPKAGTRIISSQLNPNAASNLLKQPLSAINTP